MEAIAVKDSTKDNKARWAEQESSRTNPIINSGDGKSSKSGSGSTDNIWEVSSVQFTTCDCDWKMMPKLQHTRARNPKGNSTNYLTCAQDDE